MSLKMHEIISNIIKRDVINLKLLRQMNLKTREINGELYLWTRARTTPLDPSTTTAAATATITATVNVTDTVTATVIDQKPGPPSTPFRGCVVSFRVGVPPPLQSTIYSVPTNFANRM